ncbi:MAG: tRNA pseudouridine(38-40) synthase TruA [Propionibacteriaceae bacterium]|jgi:tRNA pseudouridine38-40 synthase|nr:tRNA pseudouridine(38-40) synthase TruA [Propionibacteriaceae bacterium]
MRIRIDLAYAGTHFSGWARQPGLRTVQGVVESTIAQVLRLEEPVSTVCAGRTDAGVHARGQVAHLDLPDTVWQSRFGHIPTDEALSTRLPRALPDDIAVHKIQACPDSFDARFAAIQRRYVYRLWDQWTAVDPLTANFIVAYPHRLDVDAMAAAADRLLGLHDFAAFCRPKAGGTTIRRLLRLEPRRHDDRRIEITVMADAFCHSMVRSLVGGLVDVGRGHRDPSWLVSQLDADHRAGDIVVMPAHGLTLEEVTYPPPDQWPERVASARHRRDCDCGDPR